MSEAKMFLDSLAKLERDFALGEAGLIAYAIRKGSLIKLIDAERTPVADKALAQWLDSGTPHLKGWLREQGAEVILQSAGPIKRGPEANVYIEPFPVGGTLNAVALDIFYPSGLCFTGSEYVRSYPLREECADAAQWLVMNGVLIGRSKISAESWLKFESTPQWIIEVAGEYQIEYDAKRQPVADAAQVLFTVFDCGSDDPVATLAAIEASRKEFADAAQKFWMIAPEPIASVTITRSLEQLVRDARYWRDLRMASHVGNAVAIANGMHRPGASDRIHKIAALLLEEETANEGR